MGPLHSPLNVHTFHVWTSAVAFIVVELDILCCKKKCWVQNLVWPSLVCYMYLRKLYTMD